MTDLDASRTARRFPRPRGAARPAATFALLAAAALPAIAAGVLLLGAAPAVAAALSMLFAAAAALALPGLRTGYPHASLGACNLVTLGRAALVAIVATAILDPGTLAHRPFAVPALAAFALALDGVDGWLARRADLTSAFGARFDMEVDVTLAAVLATILMRAGPVEGPLGFAALLVLGGARYGFVLAGYALPWLRGDLPPLVSRKAVCVVQIATLGILLLPVWGGPIWDGPVWGADVATALAVAAAGLLVWSFGRDILWLARRAP